MTAGAIAGAAELLVAGFVAGRVRTARADAQPRRAARGRIKAGLLLAPIAFPVVTLMLAQLFDSAVLGWVFGLSLMAGFALVPCAAIFFAGRWLGSRGGRGSASIGEGVANHVVRLERSTVHASDDASSRQISVSPNTTLRALVALAIADGYLPSIQGGHATWVVESSGAGGGATLRPIAVCAQQWAEVSFLIPADSTVAAHFGSTPPRLNLNYRRQEDPAAVVASMTAALRAIDERERSPAAR